MSKTLNSLDRPRPLFCDSGLYVIESSLKDLVPMPGYLFGFFCLDRFGLTELPNQGGKRGEHIAPYCPEVTVILHHAKEMSE
jgi:hypothetical protein